MRCDSINLIFENLPLTDDSADLLDQSLFQILVI